MWMWEFQKLGGGVEKKVHLWWTLLLSFLLLSPEVNRLQRDKRILTNCADSNALTEQEVSSLFRYDVPEQEVSSLFWYDVLVLRWYSRHASLAVQEADPKVSDIQ